MIGRRPEGTAVLDGVPVDASALALPWSDPGAQWGLGVFETVAVRGGAPRRLPDHLDLLAGAGARLAVGLPASEHLTLAAERVAAGVAGGHGWIKVLVSRSGRWTVFGGPSDREDEARVVSAIVLPWRRHRQDPLAGIKTLAYAGAILGLEEARRCGADEGIWLNDRGHVVEACTANLFVVRGRAAVTPAPSDGARPGVTRGLAIEALRGFGLQVRVSKLRVIALRTADEIFLTSSLGGIRPLVRLDGRDLRGGIAGPVTRRLALELAAGELPRDPVAPARDAGGGAP